MRAALWVVMCAAVGCKGKDSKPDEAPASPPKPTRPVDARAAEPAAAEPVPCPGKKTLAATLARSWKIGGDRHLVLRGCAAGLFPEPGWFVAAFVDSGDPDAPDESVLRHEIVAPTGEVLAAAPPSELVGMARLGTSVGDLTAVDLDGDGVDEVTYGEGLDFKATRLATFNVMARRGAALESLLSLTAALAVEDWSDEENQAVVVSCSATIEIAEIAGGKREIVATSTSREIGKNADPEDAARCLEGTRRYRLIDGKLAAVKP